MPHPSYHHPSGSVASTFTRITLFAFSAVTKDIGKIVIGRGISARVVTHQMAIYPNGAVPEDPIEGNRDALSFIRLGHLELFPVKSNPGRQITIAGRLASERVIMYEGTFYAP